MLGEKIVCMVVSTEAEPAGVALATLEICLATLSATPEIQRYLCSEIHFRRILPLQRP